MEVNVKTWEVAKAKIFILPCLLLTFQDEGLDFFCDFSFFTICDRISYQGTIIDLNSKRSYGAFHFFVLFINLFNNFVLGNVPITSVADINFDIDVLAKLRI